MTNTYPEVAAWDARCAWNEPHECATLEELAEKVAERDWTTCTAFALPGKRYIVAHVSGGEWRILRDDGDPESFAKIESITFGWCDRAKALHYLTEIAAGRYDGDEYGRAKRSAFVAHRSCGACA